MLNLKNSTIMKKIMSLAIIALVAVAMVSCCGQPKKKVGACGEPCCQPKTECVECPAKAECPKANVECPQEKCQQCPQAAECPKAKAECPVKAECPKIKKECPKAAQCSKQAAEAAPATK